jgi:1,2-diacylglycerol 3-alpha-glucosyltransferase
MNILLYTPIFAPVISGVTTRILHLITYFKSRGHSVCIITPCQASVDWVGAATLYVLQSVPLPFFTAQYPDVREPSPLTLGHEFHSICERFRPDVIHVFGPTSAVGSLLPIADSLQIPMLMSYNTDVARAIATCVGLPLKLVDLALAYASQVSGISDTQCMIAVSHGSLANLTQRGLIRVGQCTDVMLPIVDTTLFRPVRPQPRLFKNDGSLRVVFCGRLGAEKRVSLLIEALQHTTRPVQLVLIGDGEYRTHLEQEATAATVDRQGSIRFVGAVENHLLAPYYSAADVFVSASDFETCGLTTLEAMACGLPALLFPHGGAVDHLQDGRTGIACRTAQEFAAAMDRLHLDKVQYQRLARSAQEYAQGCTVRACGEHLLSRYRQVRQTYSTTLRHTGTSNRSSPLWTSVTTASCAFGYVTALLHERSLASRKCGSLQ